jgi:hypothetical protein
MLLGVRMTADEIERVWTAALAPHGITLESRKPGAPLVFFGLARKGDREWPMPALATHSAEFIALMGRNAAIALTRETWPGNVK